MRASAAAAVLAATVLLAGCGGGKSTTSTTSAGAPQSTAVVKEIKKSWTAFFSGSTSAQTRISLLENGQKFASLINAINASPLAKQVEASVSDVKVTSATTADVTYTVSLAGQTVLNAATGQAVLVAGTWKVGDASFCRLVKLQGVVPTACK